MTVKEAIERLRYDREMCYFNPNTGEAGEPYDEDCKVMADALDIAIKALEIEPVGDCISRQTAIDDAHSQIWYRLNPNMRERIDTWLVNLPSVHLEQKTGYWIGEELGKCSNCGHSGCASDIWNGCEQMFCPNCGAKMESEECQ